MSMHPSILLVEDNEGDVELTHRAMENSLTNCDLVVANDGVEALELLYAGEAFGEEGVPRLILVDLNMPRMDGKAFLETIKTDARLGPIPVIVLSSSRSRADIRACYERHANCYIVKPFDGRAFIDELAQIMRFWLDRAAIPDSAALN